MAADKVAGEDCDDAVDTDFSGEGKILMAVAVLRWQHHGDTDRQGWDIMALITEASYIRGSTLVIENLGSEIDSTIDPVLKRNIVKKGRQSFRSSWRNDRVRQQLQLFLQTKLSNPLETRGICTVHRDKFYCH